MQPSGFFLIGEGNFNVSFLISLEICGEKKNRTTQRAGLSCLYLQAPFEVSTARPSARGDHKNTKRTCNIWKRACSHLGNDTEITYNIQ